MMRDPAITWTLQRLTMGKTYTLGMLSNPNNYEYLFSIEAPWHGNERFLSCIPSGLYSLHPYDSRRYPETLFLKGGTVGLESTDGAHRTNCVLHAGNYGRDFMGCIGFSATVRAEHGDPVLISPSREHTKRVVRDMRSMLDEQGSLFLEILPVSEL